MSFPEAETIQQGREAWSRLQAHERTSWDDWKRVGAALLIARRDCMLEAKANSPLGWRYNAAMGKWLRENGLDGISGQDRHKLLECLAHEAEIESWRAGLSEAQRRRLNHPGAVWARYCADFAPGRRIEPKPRTKTTHAPGKIPRNMQKAVHWPQDFLRRFADAYLVARHSSDVYVMAREVLEKTVRNEADLIELLNDKPPAPAGPHRATRPAPVDDQADAPHQAA